MKKIIALLSSILVFLLVLCFTLPQFNPSLSPTEPTKETVEISTSGSTQTQATETSQPVTEVTTVPPTTEAPTEPVVEPKDNYLLSFAGDCTFGNNYTATEDSWGTFTKVVGTNYAFPFAKVKDIFAKDDLSLVNLEGALTTYDPTPEELKELGLSKKEYRFRGDPAYAQVLVEGSIEVVSAANNHSLDYARPGHAETQSALTAAGIRYATWSSNCLITTPSGLTVGIYATNGSLSASTVASNIQRLRNQGAEIVICSFHWGDEKTYAPTQHQQNIGRAAIDAGANIVFGHHPHVLQPIEHYHGGVILYSMGNFSFGGNRNPGDRDTAIVQQQVLRLEDGTVTLGETIIIPCSMSSSAGNNFQPIPYEPGSEGYLRTMSKLDGTYAQAWLDAQNPTNPTETTP